MPDKLICEPKVIALSTPTTKGVSLKVSKDLPSLVRDVYESLALREPQSAARYLSIYLEPRKDG